jgi:tRNA threonylcarbamoyladenosine biosynthesis protein TsaE
MTDVLATLFPATTRSEKETRELGAAYGAALVHGAVVALQGRLGSGKTQFVKGVCSALGIGEDAVSSPTFTIVHEYEGRLPVYHMDLYRLRSTDEVEALGLEEYLDGDGVCLVEWPEALGDRLPAHAVRLRFDHGGGDTRRISLAAPADRK